MRFLKLFGFISVMIVHTKCKLNNAELFLELPVIQSKEIQIGEIPQRKQR